MKTLLFTADDVARLLPPARCLEAVESAFRLLGAGQVPPPATLGYHTDGGGFHIKAGRLGRYFAAKLNGNFAGNHAKGLPTIQGLVVLSDATDGRVLAVMDSVELTARRTAAATALAARTLARPGAGRVAIIGCGTQAPAQLDALREVLDITHVTVHDTSAARAHAFAAAHNATVADTIRSATLDSDIVVTCTTSQSFLLFENDVRPGTFIAAVGVDNESKREIAPALMASAIVVTDVTDQCARIGDLHHAIDAGVMRAEDVHAELPALIAHKHARPAIGDRTVIFDSTGIGLQDVAAAAAVFEAADSGQAGIGFS